MNDLDLKDKKLIALLHRNSRAKLHELASELKLSKNSVKYRIDRLVEKKYILHFNPTINYVKINLTTFDLFIRLRLRKEQEKIIIDYFRNDPNVLWACTLLGEWDFLIQYVSTDFESFYFNQLKSFLSKFSSVLDDYEVKISIQRIKIKHCVPEYESLIKEEKILPKQNNSSERPKISEIDRKLLHALSLNARASFQELGQEIGESLETTRNHFNALVEEGVLQGFTINFDQNKIGYVDYLIFCKFHNFEGEKEFQSLVNSKKEIKLGLKNGNVPEIYLLVSTRSPYEMESLVKEIKDKFYNQIHEIKHATITQDFKLDLFPEGVVNIK